MLVSFTKYYSYASVMPKSWQQMMKVSLLIEAFNLASTLLLDACIFHNGGMITSFPSIGHVFFGVRGSAPTAGLLGAGGGP